MTEPTSPPSVPMTEVRYEYTPSLPGILAHLGVSLAVTTYQAGKLLTLGVRDDQLQISFCTFDRAMGLAIDRDRFAVGARRQIHLLRSSHDIAPQLEPRGAFDSCWAARSSFYTGNIHGHELAWGADGLWVVNTLFSTLCTLHEDYSFVPRWRPPFITELAPEDRCHLNGVAMVDGRPRYVTMMSETNTAAGWRPTKATTGLVMDVASSEPVVRGLAMPHSPRWHNDRLWVLNSGCGTMGVVDSAIGRYEVVESMPGYTRGLAFAGQFAFVGLSRIRETSVFGGLPLEARREELKCGVGVIDLVTGRTVSVFQFHTGVEEIFAVHVIPNSRNPAIRGPIFDRDDDQPDVWICPPPGSPPPSEPRVPDYARPPKSASWSESPPATTAPSRDLLVQRGRELHRSGRLTEAIAAFEQALALESTATVLVDLGNVLQDIGRQDVALQRYQQALDLDPDCVAARQNVGAVLTSFGEAERALEQFEHLARVAPTPINRLLSATVLPTIYDHASDVDRWRQRMERSLQGMLDDGVRLDTSTSTAPTTFFLAYQGRNDRDLLAQYGRLLHVPSTQPLRRRSLAGRKLRVGFLSNHFHDHTIGRLNVGRIERLDRSQFEVVVLYQGFATDPVAMRFQRAADRFVPIASEIATARRQVIEQELDVLVFADVGMGSMISTLAYSRMAPVQAVTWGHPNTTGSPEMDFFISSELLEEASAQAHYTEQLVRLPLMGTYYERPGRTGPERSREYFGLDPRRRVYLCPQTLFKFHPEFDAVLHDILTADPGGDLVCIESRSPQWQARLMNRWRCTLPDAERRVRFVPAQPRDDFLALLQTADVMLDPMHFGGGHTSYEALAFGVPIVTLPGKFLRSRITAGLYRKLNRPELISNSTTDYIQQALHIATDADYRCHIKYLIGTADLLYDDPAEVDGWNDWLDRCRR